MVLQSIAGDLNVTTVVLGSKTKLLWSENVVGVNEILEVVVDHTLGDLDEKANESVVFEV